MRRNTFARSMNLVYCLACMVMAVSHLACGNAPFDLTTLGGNLIDDTNPPDPGPDGTVDPPPDTTDNLPANAYCDAVADWDAGRVQFEADVLDLINTRRGEGATCGDLGTFEPAGPLTVNGALTCAARNHSMDMGVRDFFSHTNPDGDGPGDRIVLAEYVYSNWGENIARGYPSPEAVVEGWMNSQGHCANLMNPSFTETGVGYYDGNYWTQVFGRPR